MRKRGQRRRGFSCLPDFHTFSLSKASFTPRLYNYNIDADGKKSQQ